MDTCVFRLVFLFRLIFRLIFRLFFFDQLLSLRCLFVVFRFRIFIRLPLSFSLPNLAKNLKSRESLAKVSKSRIFPFLLLACVGCKKFLLLFAYFLAVPLRFSKLQHWFDLFFNTICINYFYYHTLSLAHYVGLLRNFLSNQSAWVSKPPHSHSIPNLTTHPHYPPSFRSVSFHPMFIYSSDGLIEVVRERTILWMNERRIEKMNVDWHLILGSV